MNEGIDEAGHEEEFVEDAAEAGADEAWEAHDASAGQRRGKSDTVRDEKDEFIRRLSAGKLHRPLPDGPLNPGPSATKNGRVVDDKRHDQWNT